MVNHGWQTAKCQLLVNQQSAQTFPCHLQRYRKAPDPSLTVFFHWNCHALTLLYLSPNTCTFDNTMSFCRLVLDKYQLSVSAKTEKTIHRSLVSAEHGYTYRLCVPPFLFSSSYLIWLFSLGRVTHRKLNSDLSTVSFKAPSMLLLLAIIGARNTIIAP